MADGNVATRIFATKAVKLPALNVGYVTMAELLDDQQIQGLRDEYLSLVQSILVNGYDHELQYAVAAGVQYWRFRLYGTLKHTTSDLDIARRVVERLKGLLLQRPVAWFEFLTEDVGMADDSKVAVFKPLSPFKDNILLYSRLDDACMVGDVEPLMRLVATRPCKTFPVFERQILPSGKTKGTYLFCALAVTPSQA
ncbi:MAG: hypothetical protein RLZZ324_902 [Candidatus Parcubacteria bacterium]|jgi:hypothetical protein